MAAHKAYYEEMERARQMRLARAELDLARAKIRINELQKQIDDLLNENKDLKHQLADRGDGLSENEVSGEDEMGENDEKA